jgi:hypothetical protein
VEVSDTLRFVFGGLYLALIAVTMVYVIFTLASLIVEDVRRKRTTYGVEALCANCSRETSFRIPIGTVREGFRAHCKRCDVKLRIACVTDPWCKCGRIRSWNTEIVP